MLKKLLIIGLLTGFMFGCANNTTVETPAYAGITMDRVKEHCKPSNFWQMTVITTPMVMIAYENCLDIDFLIMMMTPYGEKNISLEKRTVQIVMEHYTDHKNKTDKENIWNSVFLKHNTIVYEDIKSHVLFYSLESSKKSK